jgi:hypothetical protein
MSTVSITTNNNTVSIIDNNQTISVISSVDKEKLITITQPVTNTVQVVASAPVTITL